MKNLIIDGGNLLHRTYHSAKNKPYLNSKDQNVGHIIIYFQNIKTYVEEFKPDKIYVAWDIRDGNFLNYRHLLTEYKGNRDRTEHENTHKFDKILWYMLEKLGVQCLRANKLEADDIISWLCCDYTSEDDQNVIVSSDKDFIQLLNYRDNIKILSPMKMRIITQDNYKEFTDGVDLTKYLVYKAIMGDPSDNVKGLYKYGPVKSRKFVSDFQENFSKLDDESKQTIKESIKVMDLRVGLKTYPDECDYYKEQIKKQECDLDKFFEVCEKMEMKPLLWDKSEWHELFSGTNMVEELQTLLEDYK